MDHGIMFGQVTCLLGGLFLLLIGIGLLFTLLYWRTRALRAEAEIIGVRQAGRYFHSVYRFALPGGEVHEATSGQGSTSLQGRSTGRRVPILVIPDRPDEVRESGSATLWALSIGSLAAGVWMIWFALTAWPATFFMWIVAGGVVIYAVVHAARVLKSRKDLVAQGRAQGEARWSAAPIRQAQELGASSPPQIVSAKQRRTGVIFCLAGLASKFLACAGRQNVGPGQSSCLPNNRRLRIRLLGHKKPLVGFGQARSDSTIGCLPLSLCLAKLVRVEVQRFFLCDY